MTITLLHPSRSRPKKSLDTIRNWLSKAGGIYVEVIVSVDDTDPLKDEYIQRYVTSGLKNITIITFNNTSVVDATNVAAATNFKGDILVYVSDDFDCPDNWDKLIVNEFDTLEPRLVKVDDCLQEFSVPVLTIPIMNRALYNKLGYFWHPEYKSMFVDEDLYWTCATRGWIREAPYLKFPHLHHSIGKCENDETYTRSAANWDQGKAVFKRRKRENFPI